MKHWLLDGCLLAALIGGMGCGRNVKSDVDVAREQIDQVLSTIQMNPPCLSDKDAVMTELIAAKQRSEHLEQLAERRFPGGSGPNAPFASVCKDTSLLDKAQTKQNRRLGTNYAQQLEKLNALLESLLS